jgi:DNA-binding response OmpR family regulator
MSTGTGARRIMVVDEDYELLDLVRTVLVAAGYQVATWRRRSELQAAVEAQRPALVLLDPTFRWYDDAMAVVVALRRRAMTRHIPLLVWSENQGFLNEHEQRLRALGVPAYAKPVDLKALLAQIEELLEV